MGRRATWIVVFAVLGLGAVAVADGLRGGHGSQPRAASPTTTRPSAAFTPPVGARLRGVLYYTDANCSLHGIRFPDLRPVSVTPWNDCDFSMSPRGGGAATAERTRWASDALTVASEGDGSILVASTETNGFSFRGSAPSFAPGMLTFFRDGVVRGLGLDCARAFDVVTEEEAAIERCSRVLLRRSDLRRAVLREPNAHVDPRVIRSIVVRGLAWFDSDNSAVLIAARIRHGAPVEIIAFFARRRLLYVVSAFGLAPALELSPFKSYVWGHAEEGGGVFLLDRRGNQVPLPPLPEARRLAWSPDERWVALATRSSVYITRPGDVNARVRRLELVTSDIAWRLN